MAIVTRLAVLFLAAGALFLLPSRPGPAYAATVNINAGDFWFCDSSHQGTVCTTNITAGDTVVWHFSSAFINHTVTNSTVPWDSGKVANGGMYMRTFNTPGTFAYFCTNHLTLMLGQIVVTAGGVGGVAELPDVAPAPAEAPGSSGGNAGLLAAIAGASAAAVAALGGAAWYARRRLVHS